MDKIRVMLVEDHVLVREGTRELLDREEDMDVVAEAGDGEEAVLLDSEHCPDVILMDIALPKLNGIETTRRIKAANSKAAVLVLSAYDNDEYVFAFLEAGAAGYLLKDASAEELVKEESVPAHLTERELQVLKLAAKGMTNREIAGELSISARTVQVHLSNIFGKVGVGSRTEAVLYAVREGWLRLEDTS
jgi:NarL family two-component system response regulator LiaR